MRAGLLVLLLWVGGCYVEWDGGLRTPRRDPCTGQVTVARFHLVGGCRLPPPPAPPLPERNQ